MTWSFLTNHGRALLCIANDHDVRLRDIAAELSITERHAFELVDDLTEAGYVTKTKVGRRNRYAIQAHLPVPERTPREHAIGDIIDLLAGPERRAVRRSRYQPRPEGECEPEGE